MPDDPAAPTPYLRDSGLMEQGTGDKMWVGGHSYSDKPPVPSLLLVGWYQLLKWTAGLSARDRPDLFCYWMTVASSGLAYVVAVWSIYRLGLALELSLLLRCLLTASFGLATVALPYTRHVNSHIWLLGVAAPLILGLARLANESASGRVPWFRSVALGMLAGLGYTLDSAAGPILVVCTFALVTYRCPRVGAALAFVLAALPWIILHHGINYALFGEVMPANANPAYWDYPGSGFDAKNLTGHWNHKNWDEFADYAATLWIGERGFLALNIPLWLALPAFALLLLRRIALPELLFTATWAGGTWLAYAALSTNYSGHSVSIRWFLPLLAPGYLVLAIFLRRYPQCVWDFVALSIWGAIGAFLMWSRGPWWLPRFWVLQSLALLSWVGCWAWRSRNVVEDKTESLTAPTASDPTSGS